MKKQTPEIRTVYVESGFPWYILAPVLAGMFTVWCIAFELGKNSQRKRTEYERKEMALITGAGKWVWDEHLEKKWIDIPHVCPPCTKRHLESSGFNFYFPGLAPWYPHTNYIIELTNAEQTITIPEN